MSYTPNFAITFINIKTGNAMIDAGTSDLKTAKGAVRNWYKNVGHVLGSWLSAETYGDYQLYGENIKIIARPIDCSDDAINMKVERIQAEKYIKREQRNGATILTMDELF